MLPDLRSWNWCEECKRSYTIRSSYNSRSKTATFWCTKSKKLSLSKLQLKVYIQKFKVSLPFNLRLLLLQMLQNWLGFWKLGFWRNGNANLQIYFRRKENLKVRVKSPRSYGISWLSYFELSYLRLLKTINRGKINALGWNSSWKVRKRIGHMNLHKWMTIACRWLSNN